MSSEFTQTQKTLLGLVSMAINGEPYSISADTDWSELFRECKVQAVAPMVFQCIDPDQFTDQETFLKWKSFTMRSIQNNMKIHLHHGEIHDLLTANHIPYCIVKGCASARDYPDPLLRPMGDVDFIVPENAWDHASEVLLQAGFTSCGEDHPFHLSFKKDDRNLEMHHEPFGLHGAKVNQLLALVPEMINNSIEVNCGTVTFRMPNSFAHGLVILLHAYRHLTDVGIGVRHLCDWAVFISRFSNQEFIDIFEHRCRKLGIWKLVQIFSGAAHIYLSTPYKPWMGEVDEHLCRALMLDILDGGNFGTGAGARSAQNLSIFNEKNQVSAKGGVKQLIISLNRHALSKYPWLQNKKFLYPVGCLFVAVHYGFRVLTGKRKVTPSNTMKMAAMRKELYSKLEIFEEG